VEDKNRVVRDAAGKPQQMVGVWTGITERKRNEERLREQADIIERAQDAIIMRDFTSDLVTVWNSGAERLYGWNASEAIGTPSVRTGFVRDLYLTLVAAPNDDNKAAIAVRVNPMVLWLWIGGAVMATGTVTAGRRAGVVSPDGGRQGAASILGTYPVPNAGVGALIGYILSTDGQTSQPFLVGSQSTFTSPVDGRLYLLVNDDNYTDNSGSFSVRIVYPGNR